MAAELLTLTQTLGNYQRFTCNPGGIREAKNTAAGRRNLLEALHWVMRAWPDKRS